MRSRLLLLFGLLISLASFSQTQGQFSWGSGYELVYKISAKEAGKLSLEGNLTISDFRLHDRIPFDTLTRDEAARFTPPPGFYVRLKTEKNRLAASLEINQDFEIKKIPDGKWLRFIILDRGLEEVRPKAIYFNGHRIHFDQKVRAYRYRAGKREGIIRIEHDGREAIFPIAKGYRRQFFNRFGNKLLYRTPLKIITKPGRDIYHSIRWGQPEGVVKKVGSIFDPYLREEKNVYGYLLLNKPKYRPGDTLRYKLKLAKANGKPMKGKVDIDLSSKFKERYTEKVSLVNGQAHGEIVLSDSLNMTLDQYASLSANSGWNSLISTSFDYEEYELKSENYEINLAKEHQGLYSSNLVTLSGKDENDNRLKNSTYDLTVRTTSVTKNRKIKQLFISSVLFEKSGQLDPKKDTEVLLPDSLFSDADITYMVEVDFRNAANDLIKRTARAKYTYSRPSITMELENDSIYFLFDSTYVNSKFLEVRGVSSTEEKVLLKSRQVPHAIRANPAISTIKVLDKDGDLLKTYAISSLDPGVITRYDRSRDSLNLNITNPYGIPLWYTLFRENIKIREGFTEKPLQFLFRAKNRDSYVIHYRYLWAGEINSRDEQIDYYDKLLNIEVSQQGLVIPGVEDSIRVKVTDHKGRPVSGVDVAATAITGKFKSNNIPQVPYYGIQGGLNVRNRDYRASYPRPLGNSLAYQNWRKAFTLDTVVYYQILRPDDLYVAQFDSPDSSTQFAAIAVSNGYIEPLAYVKLDGKLVYINPSTRTSEFSFHATPGYHNIYLRTGRGHIEIDSVYFDEGKKTIVSIPRHTTDPRVKKTLAKKGKRLPLSKSEIAEVSAHTLVLQPNQRGLVVVKQGKRVHQFMSSNYATYSLGVFERDSLSITSDKKKYEIEFEPGYVYELGNERVFRKVIKETWPSFGMVPESGIFSFLWAQHNSLVSAVAQPQPPLFNLRNTLSLADYQDKPDKGVLAIHPPKMKLDQLLAVYLLPNSQRETFEKLDSYLISELDTGWNEIALVYNDSTFIKERLYIQGAGITLLAPDLDQIESIQELFKLLPKAKTDSIKSLTIIRSIATIPAPTEATAGYISGVVTGADDGLPLPGVTVLVKGTSIGAPTDMNGFYKIPAPAVGGTLVFRYLGYVTQEVDIGNRNSINIQLGPDAMSLGEVVVTASGVADATSQNRAFSPAPIPQMLLGRVPGVALEGDSHGIRIRGLNSVRANQQPLVIIDGVPGAASSINQSDILSISSLNGQSATALYGARAANGVMIITTKSGSMQVQTQIPDFDLSTEESSNYSLRTNFRDYAYWVPSVTTGSDGTAAFVVTYPDDITSWNHHFLAMNNKGLTGQAQTTSKAFKPIAARLSLPRFLVEGDSSTLYGEISNYTADSMQVSRKFQLGANIYDLKSRTLKDGLVDSLKFVASSTDSIEATYQFSSRMGNDGEKRSMPVIKQGLEQREGEIYILDSDTSFTIYPKVELGLPEVNVLSNLRELLLEDIQTLHRYGYWCNEQKASKLIALLAERTLKGKMDQDLDSKRQVKQLIRKLRKAKNDNGTWGWWEGMNGAPWVTNHVIRALALAEKQAFETKTDLSAALPRLIDKLPLMRGIDLIESMETIQALAPKTDLSNYLEVVKAQSHLNTADKLRIILMEYKVGGKVSKDSVYQYEHKSALGGIYYEGQDGKLFSSKVMSTLAAYRLLKAMGDEEERLAEIRRYLMLNRESGRMNNTYEAALIIHTIGSDLVSTSGKSAVLINGEEVTQFPSKIKLKTTEPIQVDMRSNSTSYLTVSQNFWNKAPEVDDDFAKITTVLVNHKGDTVNHLEKGEHVRLLIKVSVSEGSPFAMLEVPIPAGTSYQDKPRSYGRGNYREYFKDKVNFYFEYLKKGDHEFEIPLSVLFPGSYTLNPLKLSLMYRPLIDGNNALKRIQIR